MGNTRRPAIPPHYSTNHLWWWTGTQWVPASPPPPLAVGTILAALALLTLALAAGLLVYGQVGGTA